MIQGDKDSGRESLVGMRNSKAAAANLQLLTAALVVRIPPASANPTAKHVSILLVSFLFFSLLAEVEYTYQIWEASP